MQVNDVEVVGEDAVRELEERMISFSYLQKLAKFRQGGPMGSLETIYDADENAGGVGGGASSASPTTWEDKSEIGSPLLTNEFLQ